VRGLLLLRHVARCYRFDCVSACRCVDMICMPRCGLVSRRTHAAFLVTAHGHHVWGWNKRLELVFCCELEPILQQRQQQQLPGSGTAPDNKPNHTPAPRRKKLKGRKWRMVQPGEGDELVAVSVHHSPAGTQNGSRRLQVDEDEEEDPFLERNRVCAMCHSEQLNVVVVSTMVRAVGVPPFMMRCTHRSSRDGVGQAGLTGLRQRLWCIWGCCCRTVHWFASTLTSK